MCRVLKIAAKGPVKTFCHHRLGLQEQKFNLHITLNADKEFLAQKSAPHRDFYNVRKVWTGPRAGDKSLLWYQRLAANRPRQVSGVAWSSVQVSDDLMLSSSCTSMIIRLQWSVRSFAGEHCSAHAALTCSDTVSCWRTQQLLISIALHRADASQEPSQGAGSGLLHAE